MIAHPLAGYDSVEASARRIRSYRYVEERAMRILGGWIALTPELPVKILFGRHVWDCAQHADLWGRRLPELRSPAHQSEPANDGVVRLLDLVADRDARSDTIERVVGVYRVLKPHLAATYERHLAASNAVYEPPTRRILARCLEEERRHAAAGAALLARLLREDTAHARAGRWEATLIDALAAAGGVAGDGHMALAPPPRDVVGVDADLVAVDSAFDPAVIAADLAAAVSAHRAALAAADWAAIDRHLTASAREHGRAVYATIVPVAASEVLAQAKIGAYRVIRLGLAGRHGRTVVQLHWRPVAEGWHIHAVEIVRSDAGAAS